MTGGTALSISQTITGGTGGNGGAGADGGNGGFGGIGGSGGRGGVGLFGVAGGNGGSGSSGAVGGAATSSGGNGGNGAVGADGLQLANGGTVTNSDAIVGGAGGTGGAGGNAGSGGAAGSGAAGGTGGSGFTAASIGDVATGGGIGSAGGFGGDGGSASGHGGNGGDGASGGNGGTFANGGTLINAGNIAGGSGGSGGNAGNGGDGGSGGAGGVGGDGGAGGNDSINPTFSGGAGGNGGNAGAGGIGGNTSSSGGNGGHGGDGGIGATFANGGTLINQGAITGGNAGAAGTAGNAGQGGAAGIGGQGGFAGAGGIGNTNGTAGVNGSAGGNGSSGSSTGTAGVAGTAGAGGVGVTGANLTIVNSGSISGGLGGDGMTRANAIQFTGGTNTLQLQAGYSIVGNVVGTGNDALQLGGTGAATFNLGWFGAGQQYQGFASFGVTGGSWTVTGTNASPIAFTVNDGTFAVDGTLNASSVTVGSGGTLSGTGTVDPVTTTIMNGGTLAPGNASNPTGTLTIVGNLAMQSGAIYLVQMTPSASGSTKVTGTATLGGATVNAVYANGSYVNKQYTILTATNGISGTFGSLANTNLPADFKTALSYDANDVFLNLSLAFVPPPGSGLNGNQQAVGNAISNFFNRNGSIPLVFGSLTPAGLTQLSGETATAAQQTTFDAMGQFMGLMTDPFMNRSGANPASGAAGYEDEALGYTGTRDAYAMFTKAPAASFAQRWSVWTASFGGSQTTDGNATTGSNNTSSNVYGTAVGADYLFSPSTVAGFSLAGGGTNFSVANGGSGWSDLFQAGAYVRHNEGPAYISAALAYGWQDITTNRTVTTAGFDQLRAEFNANAWSGRVEGGYRFASPTTFGIGITPYAAAQFVTFDLPAYAEQAIAGTNNFALNYGARDVTDPRTELGIRTDKSWLVGDGILTLRGRFAWAHDYNPDRGIAATFQPLPGASFVVNGAAQASDSALTTASIEMKWRNGWSAAATFEGEFSDVTDSYAGKGVVRYQW
jgi:uncharacterized protein with beta-barrel porin domain